MCACARARARARARGSLRQPTRGKKTKESVTEKDREISGRRRECWGEGPAPGEAGRMDAGMRAERAGGREAHMCEGETVMSAFPSGLVTWSLPGKQTGNRLHKGRACLLGEAGGAAAAPFPLCCVLNELAFGLATRWSLSGIAW